MNGDARRLSAASISSSVKFGVSPGVFKRKKRFSTLTASAPGKSLDAEISPLTTSYKADLLLSLSFRAGFNKSILAMP